MAGSLSNYAENKVLDDLLAGTKYVGLFTDAAGIEADQPTMEATTVNCPGYTRKSLTHAAASGGIKSSNATATFTATGAWVPVRYVGIWDALTNGNLLYWADFGKDAEDVQIEKTLVNTDQLTFASGALSLSSD